MGEDTPKILIVGVGKNAGTDAINAIISTVEPTQIPCVLLEGMYVTLNDGTKYKVEKQYLGEGVDYRNIEQSLSKLGIRKDIRLIEIVIDLDAAQRLFARHSADILDPLFED